MDASGLLVIDKPPGFTSHQVVARVRRLLGTRKVGHAGTLDPMATGVLILGVNRATRLLGYLALHDKRYLATIRLGEATSTDDAEGESLGGQTASGIGRDDLEAAVAPYRGRISQVPSSVSAIKVNGQRSYARVRAGEDVVLAAREVTVTRFDVLDARQAGDWLDVDVDVECSSGTYIRALARDLGRDLGVGGHLTSLRRTRIGDFGLDLAADVDLANFDADTPAPALMTMATAARLSFPCLDVDADVERDIRVGRSLDLELPGNPTGLIAIDPSDLIAGDLLALYRPDADTP
ncbi:MAG TPA: tRNA pseudouridine(55) synthase TruB, partial [Propionibacteriaceae bacterium]|nr:tRNA pseudouridine(55) synthase TruB [Propionibacteriaceae bacterium]